MNVQRYLIQLLFFIFLSIVPMLAQPLWVANDSIPNSMALTLDSYLFQVKNHNLSYLAQQQRIQIARAEVIAQRLFPNPTLLFDAFHGSYIVDLEYQLELGKRKGRLELAKNQATLEELAVAYFLQELRAEASQAFWEAAYRKACWMIAENSYHSMHQLYQTDSIRAGLGEISRVDARRTKVEATTLWGEMVMERANYQAALVQLERYMGASASAEVPSLLSEKKGTPPTQSVSLLDNLASIAGFSRVGTPGFLAELCLVGQENRQEILLAMQQTQVASRELKLAKVNRRPDVGVHVGYERDWNGFMPSRRNLFAGVSVPLTFSALNKGAVYAAKYRQQQSEKEAADVQNLVETEITQAYFFYEAAKARIEQYQSGLLDEAHEVIEGMRHSYIKGETGVLDILWAQRNYNEVQKEYVEAVKELFAALVELQRSCGMVGSTL